MSRWRIIEVDPGDSIYCQDIVIADWLTKAEAKSIFRHYYKVTPIENWADLRIEVLFEEVWHDATCAWSCIAVENQENWFDEMGFDYSWWLQFDEIRKVK